MKIQNALGSVSLAILVTAAFAQQVKADYDSPDRLHQIQDLFIGEGSNPGRTIGGSH